MSAARNSGHKRTARRARASAPPSSRSTTQTAFEHSRPASRRAATASAAAPPLVTTSSRRHTRSPGENVPSRRFAVPYSFACPRTMTNGNPTGKRGGRGERHGAELGGREPGGVGLDARHGLREAGADLAQELRVGREAVLVEVERRAPPRPEHEVPFEVRALADGPRQLGVAHVGSTQACA